MKKVYLIITILFFSTSFSHHDTWTYVDSKWEKSIPFRKVHPGIDLSIAHPDNFSPKVGGFDFLFNGNMIVATYGRFQAKNLGKLYVFENPGQLDPKQIKVTEIASGLSEPLGVRIVNDDIYVITMEGLLKYHKNAQGGYDSSLAADLTGIVKGSYDWASTLIKKDNSLYTVISHQGVYEFPLSNPSTPIRWTSGVRQTNGLAFNEAGDMFFTDNQGEYRAASPIWLVEKDFDYGYTGNIPPELYTKNTIWAPQWEAATSLTSPFLMNDGPYQGQFIVGDNRFDGVNRFTTEKVKGQYQGAFFRFTGGIEAGVMRTTKGPNGYYYFGGLGLEESHPLFSVDHYAGEAHKLTGLQKFKWNDKPFFDYENIVSVQGGFELKFTEQPGNKLFDPNSYTVTQWDYGTPIVAYGGIPQNKQTLHVAAVKYTEDKNTLFLDVRGIQGGKVLRFEIDSTASSVNNNEIFVPYFWYTLNRISDSTSTYYDNLPVTNHSHSVNDIKIIQSPDGFNLIGLSNSLSTLTLYNMRGEKVSQITVEAQDIIFPTQNLQNGVYTLQVFSGASILSQRIVIW